MVPFWVQLPFGKHGVLSRPLGSEISHIMERNEYGIQVKKLEVQCENGLSQE